MKKTTVLTLSLVLLILLSGCAAPAFITSLLSRFTLTEPAEAAVGTVIWRAAADPSDGGDLIRSESFPAQEADLEELLAAFCAPSQADGLRCALPDGVSLSEYQLENGVLTLDLSAEFLDESEMDRGITAFCAAFTFCQLEGVEAVTVSADGQTLFAGIMPEDAFLTAADTDPYVRQLRLYFPDSGGRYLISEYHSLTLDEDTSPERYVIEELLRGPNNGELSSVIPAGTALLSCSASDGVCTVDFSAAFYENRPGTPLGERLVLYAVVNSLTALSDVDSVRFLVEGKPVDTYVCRTLDEPLERYDEAIGPVSAPRGEVDVDLYLALPDLTGVTPLPFRVNSTDYDTLAEAVLAALLSASEPGYPSVFPGSNSVTGVTAEGSLCTVDLAESFFISLPEEARNVAVQSITATLCALPDISGVRLTIGGSDAVFEGADWSGPWSGADIINNE